MEQFHSMLAAQFPFLTRTTITSAMNETLTRLSMVNESEAARSTLFPGLVMGSDSDGKESDKSR